MYKLQPDKAKLIKVIRKKNLEFHYQMKDWWVKWADEERDLAVLISKDLKFSKQCLLAKKKS